MGVNKSLTDPAYNATGWNTPLNANFDNIDQAFGGNQVFNLASASGTVSVSSSVYVGAYPANTASYIPLSWTLNGTLTASVTLQIPASIGGQWNIYNNTTMGSYTITVQAPSALSTVSLVTGAQQVYSDGAGNVRSTTTAVNGTGSSSNTQVLYNNGGSVAGTSNLTTDGTNVTVGGNVTAGGSAYVSGNAYVTGTMVQGSPTMYRNRLINGGMDIDQRNGGASGTGNGVYTVDRWNYFASQASKGTWGRNLNSVTAPAGFGNYLGFQSSSAYSVVSTDYFGWNQPIEAYNTVDFAFGTSSARTITLSFWAYSSLTGNFGGSVSNYASTRSYCFSYNIPTANTWTYISVTIPGDTGGAWVATGVAGSMYVRWGLGCGSTYTSTANVWLSGNYIQPNSTVSVVGSNSATFYITGAQFELGNAATPFERRMIGIEFALCQRYYQQYINTANNAAVGITGVATASSQLFGVPMFLTTAIRSTPTSAFVGAGWTGSNATGITLIVNSNSVFIYASSGAAGFCQIYAPLNSGFSLTAEL